MIYMNKYGESKAVHIGDVEEILGYPSKRFPALRSPMHAVKVANYYARKDPSYYEGLVFSVNPKYPVI